jgi:hypothetical protein
MKDIEKNLVIYGSLQTEAHKLDNIRCEIHLNLTDTSQLSADVYDLEGTIGFRYAAEFTGKMIRFDSISDNEEIHFEGGRSSGQIGGGSDKIGRIQIDRYEETTHINRNPIQSISFTYYLTPIEIFKRKSMRVTHDSRGLLFGYDWLESDTQQWKDESFTFSTAIGDFVFYPGLIFSEENDDVVTVKNQMKVLIQVKADNINVHETRSQVEAKLCEYLQMLSFIESRFTNWFVCEIDARGASGKGFVADIYERIPQWRYPWDQHLQMHAVEYHKVLPLLVERYSSLDGESKTTLDKALRQLLVATKPNQPVDTELVYWHSSLEVLTKILAKEKMKEYKYWGFSKRLLQVCDDAKIEWMDLYPEIKKEEVLLEQSPQKLEITNIRNAMIHDGDYPAMDKYDAVFLENTRAAALAERMVMCVLGMDYRETPVGKYRRFRG